MHEAFNALVGNNGHALLGAPGTRIARVAGEIQAIGTLRLEEGVALWRTVSDNPSVAILIGSPCDTDAHYPCKSTTS